MEHLLDNYEDHLNLQENNRKLYDGEEHPP